VVGTQIGCEKLLVKKIKTDLIMKKIGFLLLLMVISIQFFGQTGTQPTIGTALPKPKFENLFASDPSAFLEKIKAENLRNFMSVLTSDSLEGRETGQEGQRKAADFIARQFEKAGLPAVGDNNSFFQTILLTAESWETNNLAVNGKDFKNNFNYYVYPNLTPDGGAEPIKIEELVFAGYGIDDAKYSDFSTENDWKDKAILIYDGEPRRADSSFVMTGNKIVGSEWSKSWKKKAEAAKKRGVAAIFIIDPNIQQSIKTFKVELSGFRMTPKTRAQDEKLAPTVFISQEIAEAMIGKKMKKVVAAREAIRATGQPKNVELKAKVALTLDKNVKEIAGSNVIGYIEGSDERLKKEYVVISAHYDHLGKREGQIYHGADDNASGTSTVIEIALAMAEAKKMGKGPKRSVVCLLVSGEEKGLLGSDYYTQFPIFPLEKTVADINIDMVGRIDDAHKGDANYVYVIGSDRLSTELHTINEESNGKYTQLALDYKYNAKDDPNQFYYRSDHYNFAKNGIPVIFFFNGVHADYHRPTDTMDKIDFDKMAKIGKLAFATAWEIANRPGRIRVDKKSDD
jgi:Peptidase family M28